MIVFTAEFLLKKLKNYKWGTPLDKMNITFQMYPCSEGTDTDSPAIGYRESGTGIPHFITCEFTRLMPDPSRILHAWICNSSGPLG